MTTSEATRTTERSKQTTDKNAIRPFRVEFSGSGADRFAQAHQGDKVARSGDCRGRFARRAVGDNSGACALLGDQLRLAQVSK